MSKYHFRLLVLLLSKCTWNNDQIPLIFWEVLSNWIGVSKPQKMPISHLYWCGSTNLYSRHSAWLDGAGKCRSCQNHPVDQRSPKGLSSQTSWTTSISWAPHQPTELRGPSVSSTCTALFNHQLLVDLPESCQTCPLACRARFSSTTLTLRP